MSTNPPAGTAPARNPRLRSVLVLVSLSGIFGIGTAAAAPPNRCPAAAAALLAPARDFLVVTTANWSSTPATLRRFVRSGAGQPWAAAGPPVEAVVGRRGLAWGRSFPRLARAGEPRKVEGDGRSPAGVYRIGRPFGLAPSDRSDFLHLGASTLCIDDPRSRHYNHIVDGARTPRDWRSAERMGATPLYRRGFVVDYPTAAAARGGSCIFIHEWQDAGGGTAGCIAAAPPVLEQLQATLQPPGRAAVLAVLTEARFRGLAACWPELADSAAAAPR